MILSAGNRAKAILQELGLVPATRAASGRYQRSVPITPGSRYWATSKQRHQQDLVGIQFYGEGLAEAARYGERLKRAGFQQRTPQTGQLTFAKAAPFAPSDDIDVKAIRAIRRDLDEILQDRTPRHEFGDSEKALSFRDFMLASPLAEGELSLPKRPSDWRTADL